MIRDQKGNYFMIDLIINVLSQVLAGLILYILIKFISKG